DGASSEQTAAAANRAARLLHTVKGSAGTLGFDDVVGLAHDLEGLIKPTAKGTAALPAGALDQLVAGTDRLLARFEKLGRNIDEPIVATAPPAAPAAAPPSAPVAVAVAPVAAEAPIAPIVER